MQKDDSVQQHSRAFSLCWTNTLYTTLTSRTIKKQLCGPVCFHCACLLPYRWQYWYITTVLSAFARTVFYGGCSVFFDCPLCLDTYNTVNSLTSVTVWSLQQENEVTLNKPVGFCIIVLQWNSFIRYLSVKIYRWQILYQIPKIRVSSRSMNEVAEILMTSYTRIQASSLTRMFKNNRLHLRKHKVMR